MSYFERLHPWCLMTLMPTLQHRLVARFRHRHEAEAHLKILQQMTTARYVVVFDGASEAVSDVAQPRRRVEHETADRNR
ncbi:MAG: hypothetical protein IGS50_01000 [Synechococcales cyanobacterium C42_A2020_086]|jgi:hypothetical protein|nr:hypothetical protein [Synechococcales cyanobacterium C42_A2020_086]